jgi:hypothetical protein
MSWSTPRCLPVSAGAAVRTRSIQRSRLSPARSTTCWPMTESGCSRRSRRGCSARTPPDPQVWPAVADVCIRATLASVGGRDQPRLLADLDITQEWLAEASSPSGGRRRAPWADRRDRRWAVRAIGSALLPVAEPAKQGDADAALCLVLVDCINACPQLAREQAVDPRLPLAECPQRIVVEPRWMWSPGCDWMELGYRPVPRPLPGHTCATGTERRPSETQSPAAQTARQARGMRERRAKRRRSAGNSAPL